MVPFWPNKNRVLSGMCCKWKSGQKMESLRVRQIFCSKKAVTSVASKQTEGLIQRDKSSMVPFGWGLGDNAHPFGPLCLASKKSYMQWK